MFVNRYAASTPFLYAGYNSHWVLMQILYMSAETKHVQRNYILYILQHCYGHQRKPQFTKEYVQSYQQENARNVQYPLQATMQPFV